MGDFDRIISSAPVNQQTARQMGRGVHWEPMRQFAEPLSDVPFPTKPTPRDAPSDVRPGMKFEQLSVIGLWDAPKGWSKKKGARWVMRCACGTYTLHRTKALREGKAKACGKCTYVAWLRAGMPGGAR